MLIRLATGGATVAITTAAGIMAPKYFGMSVKDTFKTWSAMETLISCVGMVLSVIV